MMHETRIRSNLYFFLSNYKNVSVGCCLFSRILKYFSQASVLCLETHLWSFHWIHWIRLNRYLGLSQKRDIWPCLLTCGKCGLKAFPLNRCIRNKPNSLFPVATRGSAILLPHSRPRIGDFSVSPSNTSKWS